MNSGGRMARPAYWEKINTQTGRRVRDSFMPGSGTLSLPVMQRMYRVLLCEDPDTTDINGNGLGQLGFADDGFLAGGDCQVLGLGESGEAAAREVYEDEVCGARKSFNAVSGRCEADAPKVPKARK